MKTIITKLALSLMLLCAYSSFAQLNTPRGSQKGTVIQRVGITDITIEYSRPSVKAREIWGKLVPYGLNDLQFGTSKAAPWRAGADENTLITFSHNATVEGKSIAAGTYGLHLIVNENDTATLILSNDTNSWGSYFYNSANDALRVDIPTKEVPHKELLTYEFTNITPNSATTNLVWAKKAFPFKIEVDVTKIVLDDIRSQFKGQTGFTRQNWEQAANYALNNGGDLDEALSWVNNALEGQFYSEKTFNGLAIKAQILQKKDDEAGFSAVMDDAASIANAGQLNRLGFGMIRNNDFDRAIKYFKMNLKNDPSNANWHDSLAEGYKAKGDKKMAIKHFKKSLSLNPSDRTKANSEKNLKELGAL